MQRGVVSSGSENQEKMKSPFNIRNIFIGTFEKPFFKARGFDLTKIS